MRARAGAALLLVAACGAPDLLDSQAIARLGGTPAATPPPAPATEPATSAGPRLRPAPPAPVVLAGQNLAQLPGKRAGVPRVVFLGDSIASGFGLPAGASAYPDLLAARLAEEGLGIEVLNGGAPGSTTAFGTVLPALAPLQPDVVVIELGGNDYILGRPLDATLRDLRETVQAGLAMGARVLLVGVHLPPALAGTTRGHEFEALHAAVAAEFSVPLVPDMFEDALGVPRFMQHDGIHPTAEGQMVVADNLLPQLRAVVKEVLGR